MRDTQQHYQLGTSLDIYEDKTNQYDFDSIKQQATLFQSNTNPMPSFGYSDATYWVKFTIKNQSQHETWILEQRFPVTHHLDIQVINPTTGKINTINSGSLTRPEERDIKHRRILFEIKLKPGEHREILARIRSEASLIIDLRLSTLNAFMDHEANDNLVFGIFYGALLIMFCYIFLIFIVLKDASFG
ncbi:MAG: 7TM-DISM domain-containing protein, partial [Gammaproteobacteria bacterium]|nr:7TM-DISM domain-containing protein [Gammaproteobacteria bacterium]